MSSLITDEMVEAATVASINVSLAPYGESITTTTDLQGGGEALAEMRAALEAVLPQVAAKVLRDAAEEINGYTDWEEYKNRTPEVPHGWSDESIYDALMSSGVITDWLRNRANRIEKS